MKLLSITLLLLCATLCTTKAQNKNDDNPKIDVYLNDYRNDRLIKATSEKSAYFAQSFYELLENIKIFKDPIDNVEGEVKYVVKQISIKRPLTRNNGQKIYNGYAFIATESIDNVQTPICTFIYDIDSNALYADINKIGKYQKLLFADQGDLNKCAKYCRFSN